MNPCPQTPMPSNTVRLLLAMFLAAIVSVASGAEKHYTVTAPDGVVLALQESGDPAGPPIVFIHGLLGSRLNWEQQVNSPALQRYRLIAYDLRGHGLSGKPAGAEPYRDGRRWADDLAAVIVATATPGQGAARPVLVGWSLGGAVISNYLAAHGDGGIAGAVYVDGVIELAAGQITPHPQLYRDVISPDLKTHLDAERAFLALCFRRQPDTVTFQRLLANAAMASWDMQAAVQTMTVAASEGLGNARVPVLLLYGAQDALVQTTPAIARARAINPRVRSIVYQEAGHAPFIEEPDRFNRDLAGFMQGLSH
jgi:non-heme chloroperoxidase